MCGPVRDFSSGLKCLRTFHLTKPISTISRWLDLVLRDKEDENVTMSYSSVERKFNGDVLVVDDNWITLKLIEQMLRGFGLEPETIDCGSKALELLEERSFDLVLLDCSMPTMDGYEVAAEIRKRETNESGRRSNIIAFTSDDSLENRLRCSECGMDGMLPKPYTYSDVEDVLQKYLPTGS